MLVFVMFCIFLLKTGFHSAAQANLGLIIKPSLAPEVHSWPSIRLASTGSYIQSLNQTPSAIQCFYKFSPWEAEIASVMHENRTRFPSAVIKVAMNMPIENRL